MKHIKDFKLNESDKPSIEIYPAILSSLSDIKRAAPDFEYTIDYIKELLVLLNKGQKYYSEDDIDAWKYGAKNEPESHHQQMKKSYPEMDIRTSGEHNEPTSASWVKRPPFRGE